MAKTVEFHDADMRRAWAEADAVERDAEQNPERIAERRRRLIKWVEARVSADMKNCPQADMKMPILGQ